MKINEVIALLQGEGHWVQWNRCTRDRILHGDDDKETTKIGICWVATKQAIHNAIEHGCNFIITHENPFYTSGTKIEKRICSAIEEKRQLLDSANITVYRCHDVWDLIPVYGVSDSWARTIGFDFKKQSEISFYQYANFEPMTVANLSSLIAQKIRKDGEDGVYVFGDTTKVISSAAIGTGAATNIFEMLDENPGVLIVSDDGITNFLDVQYALDYNLPLIVVNHGASEISGMKSMIEYFKIKIPDVHSIYLDEGYKVTYYK